MLICSGFDLNVKNEKLMDASGLHEGISWSLSMSDETSQSAKNSREHLEQVYDIVRAVVGTFKNGTCRACPLFVFLVVWQPNPYIPHTTRSFYKLPHVKSTDIPEHQVCVTTAKACRGQPEWGFRISAPYHIRFRQICQRMVYLC